MRFRVTRLPHYEHWESDGELETEKEIRDFMYDAYLLFFLSGTSFVDADE